METIFLYFKTYLKIMTDILPIQQVINNICKLCISWDKIHIKLITLKFVIQWYLIHSQCHPNISVLLNYIDINYTFKIYAFMHITKYYSTQKYSFPSLTFYDSSLSMVICWLCKQKVLGVPRKRKEIQLSWHKRSHFRTLATSDLPISAQLAQAHFLGGVRIAKRCKHLSS